MKKDFFHYVAVLLLVGLLPDRVVAQLENTNTVPIPRNQPTANSQALGKYGSVPVNLSTGQPSISVPLHTISYGGIDVAITLGYDASGIRVDQRPTWAGLGWNLQAGGVITRRVQGLPDDYEYPEANEPDYQGSQKGYLFQRAKLNSPNWLNPDTLMKIAPPLVNGNPNPHQLVDGIPDDFSFNFGGYSGTFFVDEKGAWRIKSQDNLALEIHHELNQDPFVFATCPQLMRIPRLITKFTIYTPDGTKYEFGGDTTNIEFSRGLMDDFHMKQGIGDPTLYHLTPMAWYLTRVTKPNGKYIEFIYENGRNLMRISRSIQDYEYGSAYASGTGNAIESLQGNILTPCYLKQIRTPFQIINFHRSFSVEQIYNGVGVLFREYSSSGGVIATHSLGFFESKAFSDNNPLSSDALRGWPDFSCFAKYVDNLPLDKQCVALPLSNDRIPDYSNQLDSIEVIGVEPDGTNTGLKTIQFQHTNNPSMRRFLLGVTIKGKQGEAGGSYTFSYIQPDQLPNYNSFEKDQWGYYNGINYATASNRYTNASWRLPSATLAQYGTLRSIQYPTGGTTRFEYELNNYGKYQNVTVTNILGHSGSVSVANTTNNVAGGGLRIKKIIDSANYKSPVVVRSYYYNLNHINGGTRSSGILSGRSKYQEKLKFLNFCYANQEYSVTWSDNEFSPYGEAVRDIQYSEVTEVTSDGAAKVYKYSNFNSSGGRDEFHFSALIANVFESDYYRLSSNELERGLLLSEAFYEDNGSLVYKKEYEYDYAADRKDKFAKCIDVYHNFKQYVLPIVYWTKRVCFEEMVVRLYPHKKYYYHIPLKKITETRYEHGTPIVNTQSFSYDDYGNRISTVTETSDQRLINTQIRYNVHANYLSGTVSTPEAIGVRNLFTQFKIKNAPVEQITTIQPVIQPGDPINLNDISITGARLYHYLTYQPQVQKVFKLELEEPFPAYTWVNNSFVPNFTYSRIQSGDLVYDSRYKLQDAVTHFVHGSAEGVLAAIDSRTGSEAYTVDYLGDRITSVTKGATINEIAYSSFESGSAYLPSGGAIDDNKGFWSFAPSSVAEGGFTGSKSISVRDWGLSNPLAGGITSTINLKAGKKYELVFWANGTDPLVYIGTGMQPMVLPVKTVSGWKLYIYHLTGSNQKVSIVGTSAIATKLDEVRLYPAGAQMTSYTYDWATGNTLNVTDAANTVHRYYYDKLGRLLIIKDENSKVVEQYKYSLSH